MNPVEEEHLRGILHANRMDCLIRGHGWDVTDALTAFRQAGAIAAPAPPDGQPLNAATLATHANLRIAVDTALADVLDVMSHTDPSSALHARLAGLARTLDVLPAADRVHRAAGVRQVGGHHNTRSAAGRAWKRTPDGT